MESNGIEHGIQTTGRRQGNRRGARRRAELLELLRRTPGLTRTMLQAQMSLSWATVCYHVEMLLREGKIQEYEEGGQAHLFPAGAASEALPGMAARIDPACVTILNLLKSLPQVTIGTVTASAPMGRHATTRALERLEGLGLIERRGQGHRRYGLPFSRDARRSVPVSSGPRLDGLPSWAVQALGYAGGH